MEEEKAAAYYDELSRKGDDAARFKQGLGFSSHRSPSPRSRGRDDRHSRGSRRRSSSRERGGRERYGKERRRRSRSDSGDEGRGDRRWRSRRSRSRSPRRSPHGGGNLDRERSRRSPKHESSKSKNGGVDYTQLIKGYAQMTPAERIKARMKLQLSQTGIEVGGSSKSRNRRSWSNEEEDALLDILEDIVARGQRCDTGSFKSGTILLIERQLVDKCPQSNLRANPHIESKLKVWKKQFSIIFDMLNKNGFGWNDQLKCVDVDSDDVWMAYVQNNKSAKGWRKKSFPIYERLANIFGKDRASGARAQTVHEMVNEINIETASAPNTDWGMPDESSPMSMNQTVFSEVEPEPSQPSRRKRAEPRYDFTQGFGDVAAQFIKQLDDIFQQAGGYYAKYLADELDRLGFSLRDNLSISKAMMCHPSNVEVFKKAKTDDEKREFAMMFLDNND